MTIIEKYSVIYRLLDNYNAELDIDTFISGEIKNDTISPKWRGID